MKQRNHLLIALMLAAAIIPAFRKAEENKKKALIIGIGHYKKGTGWDTLSSLRDVEIISDALEKQGFGKITSLIDEKASLEGIRSSIRSFSEEIKPGDVVYVHFSGHGQQIADNNGARDEMDGLDEALVPWDAPMTAANGYTGDKHLRDDEFGQWMMQLRQKAGDKGNVIVVLDACHSGTALRGGNPPVTRGNARPLIPSGFDGKSVKPSQEPGAVDNMTNDAAGTARIVSISACRAHEVNSEFNGYGSLSLAVTRSLEKLKKGDSYVRLFSNITAEMAQLAPGQTPVMEGQPEHEVFGNQMISQAAYFSVRSITSTQIWIEGGKLSGLYPGSKVALMPAGSTGYSDDKAVYTGTISNAFNTRALLRPDKDLTSFKPKQLWLFVIEQAFGGNKIGVGFGDGLSNAQRKLIKDNITKLAFAEWNDQDPEVRVEYTASGYNIVLADGSKPFNPVETDKAVNILLQDFMQGKMLREVSFNDPDINVELELRPVLLDGIDIMEIATADSRKVNGVAEYADEETLLFQLKNKGGKDAYINILEISPNGRVKVVLPDYSNNQNAADFRLKSGDSVVVQTFAYQATKPYGKYVLKLFATAEPISFKHIFATRGEGSGPGYEHPAAQYFRYTYNATRSENLSLSASGAGTTTEFTYILKKP